LWFSGSLIALGAAVAFLHGYQVQRNAKVIKIRAQEAEEQKDFTLAARYYRQYLLYAKDDLEAKKAQARCLDQKADKDKSRQDWQRIFSLLQDVLQHEPDNHDLRRKLVSLAMSMGQFNEAMEHITSLLKVYPNDPELKGWKFVCLVRKGDDVKTEKFLRQAIEDDKKDIASYWELANFLVVRRKLAQDADKVIEMLVKNNKENAEAHLLRAQHLRMRGQQPDADKEVTEAVALAPQNVEVGLAAAGLAMRQHKPAEARAYLKRGIEHAPANVKLYGMLAAVELSARRPDDAIAALRNGLKAVPETNRNRLLKLLAEIHIQRGDKEAAEIVQHLRDSQASQAVLDELAARQHMYQGQWSQAAQLLESVRGRFTGQPSEANRLDYLLGNCYENLGEPDRALIAYRQALAEAPETTDAQAGLASALLALGKPDEAIVEYQRVLPHDASVAPKLARILVAQNLRQGRKEDANWQPILDMLQAAAQKAPDLAEIPIIQAWALMVKPQPNSEEAFKVLNNACAKNQNEAQLWIALADTTERVRTPEKALEVLNDAEKLLGDRPELRLAKARYWIKSGRDKGGDTMLAKLEQDTGKLGQGEVPFLKGLAELYQRAGKSSDAKRLWTQLLEKDPNDMHIRLGLFDLAIQDGDKAAQTKMLADVKKIEGEDGTVWKYAEACRILSSARKDKNVDKIRYVRSLLSKVAAQRPSWAAVATREAEIYLLEGNKDAALQKLMQAVELGESSPQALHQIAQILFESRRYQEAKPFLEKISKQEGSAEVRKMEAFLKINEKDFAGGIAIAQQPIDNGSQDPRDYLLLGQVLSLAYAGDKNKSKDYATKAENAFRKAVALPAGAKLPEAWLELVRFLTANGQKDRAEAVILQAKENLPPALAPVALAQCWEALGRVDKAVEQYSAALKDNPDDIPMLRNAGSFYLRLGRLADAEPYLTKVLAEETKASESDRMWARRGLALCLAYSGEQQKFEQALNKYLKENLQILPDSIEDLRTKAHVLATRQNRRVEAARLLEELAKKQAPTLEEQQSLAQLYEQIGEKDNAYRQYVTIVTLSENPAQIAYCGRRLFELGETNAAQHALDRLQNLDAETRRPAGALILQLQALLLNRAGRSADAIAAAKQFAKSPGVDIGTAAQLYEEIGQIASAEEIYRQLARKSGSEDSLQLAAFLGRQGRLSEALDICEKLWDSFPAERMTSLALAILNARKSPTPQQFQQVERLIEKALQKQPESLALQMDVANLRTLQHQYLQAEQVYQSILDQDPTNVMALNNLAWFQALLDNNYGEAFKNVQKAIEIAGPMAELLDTRALIYLNLDKIDDAIRDLDACIRDVPTATMYFHLAQAQHKARRQKDAVESIRRARKMNLAQAIHPLEEKALDRLLVDLDEK